MIIGHLPAGYLLAAKLAPRLAGPDFDRQRNLILAGLLFSILPDFDLLYFYLIDQRQHHHHSYWTHIPAFWAMVFMAAGAVSIFIRPFRPYVLVAAAAILLHLMLDSIAGSLRWLYPFSDEGFQLVTIPARHGWWVLNFLLYWTFLLELALWAAALWLYRKRRRRYSAACMTSS